MRAHSSYLTSPRRSCGLIGSKPADDGSTNTVTFGVWCGRVGIARDGVESRKYSSTRKRFRLNFVGQRFGTAATFVDQRLGLLENAELF